MITKLFLSLVVAASLLPARLTAAESERNVEGAYAWLKSQQQPTGLVRNMTNDPFFGLYVGALAAFCYVHQGDVGRAEQMFDYLDEWRKKKWGADLSHRGFPQAWNADTGEGNEKSDRWIGDNAWLLMALNYHHAKTGSDKYKDLRNALADWLVALQDADGGIKCGFQVTGPMLFKSTEGNLDSYAALIERPEAREKIRNWLLTKMWIPEENRFRTGTTMDATALDCGAWAVSALGRDYAACLPYVAARYEYTLPMNGLDAQATGFGDLPGKKRVWFEGTGEMAVAYRVAGQPEMAAKILHNMDAVAVPGAMDEVGWPYFNTELVKPGTSHGFFAPSAAWYLLGRWGLNPMDASSWNETATSQN